jgi:hypothetical protein
VIFENYLSEDEQPHSVPQKRRYPEFPPLNILEITASFNALFRYRKTSGRNLSRNGDDCIFLRTLLEKHASYS